MDGHKNTFFNTNVAKVQQELAPAGAAEVTDYLEANLHDVNETVKQLQELSDMVLGHTVKFSVNDELGKVIVEVSPEFYRPTDVVNLLGDPSKARRELNWDPMKTSFEELVARMVEHDMKQVALERAEERMPLNQVEYLERGISK